MADKAALMTEGSIRRRIVQFALPIFWGNLFQQLYNVVDSLIVGNFVGADALAAVGSSGSLVFLLVGFFQGVFTGAGVVISRRFGAGDDEGVSVAVHTSAAFGITAGVILSILGVTLAPTFLRWMGTPESVMPNSIVYLRTYFSGLLFLALYNTATGIFSAVGDSKHPLYFLITSSCVNVVLDLLFVPVLGMGVGGAALATVISQAVSAVLGIRKLAVSEGSYRLKLRKIRFELPTFKLLLSMGLPTGVQNSIIAFANVVVQSGINMYGALAVAACGTYSKIEGFVFLPISSCALALATFIGQNLGAKQYDRAKKGARFGISLCVIIAESVGVAYYLLAPFLISLFNSDPEVVRIGTMQARTITLFYAILAASHSIAGVMRGAGRAIVPMLVMLVCWCIIRVSYILLIARGSGDIRSIFWAYPLTWALSTTVFLIYYFKADWTHSFEKRLARRHA